MTMVTIQDIKNDVELADKLLKHECTVSCNGKILHEGLWDDAIEITDPSRTVIDFHVNGKHLYALAAENDALNALCESVHNIDDLLADTKLYNKMVNESHKLPLYGICKDRTVKKRGIGFTKIYECLVVNSWQNF